MLTHDSPTKTIGPEYERKFRRLVYKEHKKVHQQMLQGAAVDDKLGSLTTFAEGNSWSELVRKHNDADDPYHLKLFEVCIIGSDLHVAHGIVRLNFSLEDAPQRVPLHQVWLVVSAQR
jgi:hypothetical protein